LRKDAYWEQAPAGLAENLKKGIFPLSVNASLNACQNLLEAQGMVVKRRDVVNVLLETMPWSEEGADAPYVLKVFFKKGPDKDSTQITWKHYKILRYRLVIQGATLVPETPEEKKSRRGREERGDYTEPVENYASVDQDYQDKLNQDWNWRLYQALSGRVIPVH
jgi:hypothetical protein